ncbi:MAG: hypothetical protein HGA87_01000 [Desulfobulbaceae bacterium]|nr:hypothetical protein [Desulfobulbaceae bacterium]
MLGLRLGLGLQSGGNPALYDFPLTSSVGTGTFTRASTANGYTNAAPSAANDVALFESYGIQLESASTNVFLNSDAPATQSIAVTTANSGKWTTSVWGAGTVTTSAGTATASGYGVADANTKNTITVTSNGNVTFTVAGADATTRVQVENLSFGTSWILTAGASATRAITRLRQTGLSLPAGKKTITTYYTPTGISTIGTVQSIWSFYTDASNYTQLAYNGVIFYVEKRVAGVSEFVTFPKVCTPKVPVRLDVVFTADGTIGLLVDGVSASAGLGVEQLGAVVALGTWTNNGDGTYSNTLGTGLLQFANSSKSRVIYQSITTLVSKTTGVVHKLYDGAGVNQSEMTTVGVTYTHSFLSLLNGVYLNCISAFTGTVRPVSYKEVYNNTSSAAQPITTAILDIGNLNAGLSINGFERNFTIRR